MFTHRYSRCFVAVSFCLIAIGAPAQQADREGFKDPALFTRLRGSVGTTVDEKDFDAYDFPVGRNKQERVEGHFAKYRYEYDESRGPRPSDLQVIRNYQNAARQIGGKVIYENEDHNQTTLRISKNGRDTWVSVEPYGPQFNLIIVERQAMQQDVIANAEALKGGLAQAGHVEVPGIFFDSNKSEIKPESKPALEEVAKLLKANPSLRVWVVGHTDSVGGMEPNQKLSEARAGAVVKTLVTEQGISAVRLKGYGVGPLSPVASNDSEEGRAKNRRVELVKQ